MTEFGQFEPTGKFEVAANSQLPRTCIVTSELVGLYRNGGLGTATTGLAQLLAVNNFSVTVIYTGRVDSNTAHWVEKYAKAGIKVLPLKFERQPRIFGPQAQEQWMNAWTVFELLKRHEFEIIHFNDTLGEGCYCFLAKKFGIAFHNSLLTLAIHSPVEWILESNRVKPHSLWYSLCITGERLSTSAADLIWAPSNYLLNWLNDHEYRMPEQVFRQQYVIPNERLFDPTRGSFDSEFQPLARQEPVLPTEIVFFGRLEERKGIRLFVMALTKISNFLAEKKISVLFMGKQSEIDGQPIAAYLNHYAANWSFSWRIEDQFDQQDAINYLKSNNCLAVIASPVDNSPCTVYEVLSHQIPFIACNSGGIPELIDPRFHKSHLFEYRTTSLAERIVAMLGSAAPSPRPAISAEDNKKRWLNFHSHWRNYLPAPAKPERNLAKWGVYIDCLGSIDQLSKSLDAIDQLPNKDPLALVVNLRGKQFAAQHGRINSQFIEDIFECSAKTCISFFEENGVTHLLMLRVGFEPLAESLRCMERALDTNFDAVIPTVLIKSTGELLPPIAGSAALSCLEHRLDSGAVAIRLENKAFDRVRSSLNLADVHLGLLEHLYSVAAEVSPLPATILATDSSDNIVLPIENSAARLSAFSSAPANDIFQMLSITLRKYPQLSSKLISGNQQSGIKAYLFSNPRPIRILLGNRLVRKLSKVLFNLSHQDKK